MRRTYSGPTLTRFGAFGELTQQGAPAGKDFVGVDTHPQFGDLGLCNPTAQGVPGVCANGPALS